MNRFSKDQNNVDSIFSTSDNWSLDQIFQVFMNITFAIYNVPVILVTILVNLYLAGRIQRFFLASSRELTRLESMSRSPILQDFMKQFRDWVLLELLLYGKNSIKSPHNLIINHFFSNLPT
jgi:hypothetical protein